MRHFAPALVHLPIVVTLATAGCGQSVATCDDACGVAYPTMSLGTGYQGSQSRQPACESSCGTAQAAATANGRGADFQALLTCISNAGSFASECAPLACGETDALGTPTGCGAADAGVAAPTGTDAGLPDAVANPDVVVVVITPVPDASAGDGGLAACYAMCDSACIGDSTCVVSCETMCQQ